MPRRRRRQWPGRTCCNRTPHATGCAGGSSTGLWRFGTCRLASAVNEPVELLLRDPIAAEVGADRAEDLVERPVREQVALDQRPDVLPSGRPGLPGLLLHGLDQGRRQAEVGK